MPFPASEALTMSDRVTVMDQGCIVQCGTPVEIYQAPQERFVANFIGLTNFVEGRCIVRQAVKTKSARSRPPAEGCAACYPTTSRREIALCCSSGRKISLLLRFIVPSGKCGAWTGRCADLYGRCVGIPIIGRRPEVTHETSSFFRDPERTKRFSAPSSRALSRAPEFVTSDGNP